MSYNPASGQWTRLNKAPITTAGLTINSLYNGYKVYFAVSTLAKKAGNLYRESDKSPSVMVVPQGAAPQAPARASQPAAPRAPAAPPIAPAATQKQSRLDPPPLNF
jgi:hypothetical protein